MNREKLWIILILIGILGIFIAFGSIFAEYYGAKSFCDENYGSYHLEISNSTLQHTCDGQKIAKYTDGWRFYTNFKDFRVELPKS